MISNQISCLKILSLNNNVFSSVNTEKLLTNILECGVLSTLEELYLKFSANFDSDESMRKFAEILAISPVLKKCDVSGQKDWRDGRYGRDGRDARKI